MLQIANLVWGRSLAPFCVPFECFVIVSASSACGKAEGKKVFVQVLSGTALRGTIRGRLFNRGLVPKWARFLVLVWLIFFSNMARKVVDFQGLLLGAFFVPVFGPGLLTYAARVPIFRPKIWTPSRGQKHNSDCNYLCPLLWRPVALELWSGSMNVCWVVLPRKTWQDQVTHSRRMKSSSKQICAHAEEADTIAERWQGPKRGITFRRQDQNPSWVVWTWISNVRVLDLHGSDLLGRYRCWPRNVACLLAFEALRGSPKLARG